MSSCLLKLIELNCTANNMKLVLFADKMMVLFLRQNKNHNIIQMMPLAVRKFKNLKSL